MTEMNTEISKSNKSNKAKQAEQPKQAELSFTLGADGFLTSNGELPTDWQSNQDTLKAMYDAKNQQNANGFVVGADHVTVVFREGTYRVRTARGFGDSAKVGGSKASKLKSVDPLDSFLANPAEMLADAKSRIQAHEDAIAKLRSVVSALEPKVA